VNLVEGLFKDNNSLQEFYSRYEARLAGQTSGCGVAGMCSLWAAGFFCDFSVFAFIKIMAWIIVLQ